MQLSYSDQPTDRDELGIAEAAIALANVLADPALDSTPLTVAVYGPWGSGKTSLMRIMQRHVAPPGQPPAVALPIWFDAWRYAQSDALWRALLVSVVDQVRKEVVENDDRRRTLLQRRAAGRGEPPPDADGLERSREQLSTHLDDLAASLYRSVERVEPGGITIDWGAAGKAAAGAALRIGLASLPLVGPLSRGVEEALRAVQGKSAAEVDLGAFAQAISREQATIYRAQVTALDQFFRDFQQLLEAWIVPAGLRLVIFVDDLDRCLPEQALGVLEAIKVFFDLRGCAFVLGMDRAVVEQAVRVRYQAFALAGEAGQLSPLPVEGRSYLDKIIQLPFEIPPVGEAALQQFLLGRLAGADDQGRRWHDLSAAEAAQVARVMCAGLEPNPRKIKRACNVFRLLWLLRRRDEPAVAPTLIASLVVLQVSYGPLYAQIVDDPQLLLDLESVARADPRLFGLSEERNRSLEARLQEQPRLKELLRAAGARFGELEGGRVRTLLERSAPIAGPTQLPAQI